MKKLLVLLLLLIFPLKVFAAAETYIVMDLDSGRVIEGSNIKKEKLTASISKIMTAAVALKYGNLQDKVVVNESILKSYGSGIYIKVGEELTLEDLLYGLMLRSGNDAAMMIADYIGGSMEKFSELMNSLAKELGMNNSRFINSHGLEEDGIGNMSTAYDMALLTRYIMQDERYQRIVSTKVYNLTTNMNTYVWRNKNRLLTSYEFTTGGKTGFTDKARRTLVTTAQRDNKRLVVVTFNDPDDFDTHAYLFEKTFKNMISSTIIKKDKVFFENNKYKIYAKKDYNVLLYGGENATYKEVINKDYPQNSYIQIYINNKLIAAEKLNYMNKKVDHKKAKIENKYLFQKLLWGVSLW